MKVNHLLVASLAMLLGFSSCTNDENSKENTGVIRLNAVIHDVKDTRLGTSWAGTEKIGFYMLEDAADFTVAAIANKDYNVASTGVMTAVDGVEATYPTDGRNVKFMAYYPYAATLTDHAYAIDLSNTAVADHDFVYATTAAFNQTNTEAIQLAFAHQLTNLVVNIQDEDGAAFEGATASVNRESKASFNLKDGVLAVTEKSEKNLAMTVTGAVAEAIILPTTSGKIVFSSEGKSYTWDISAIAFEKGKRYEYTIKLIPNKTPSVEVVGTAIITPWDKVDGGNIDVNEDEEVVTPPAEGPVYTSNITLPTGSSAVQTNAYGATVEHDQVKYKALKIGKSGASGEYKTKIGEGMNSLSFYACGWVGKEITLTVSTSDGTEKKYSLVANSGFEGSDNDFILTNIGDIELYTLDFTSTSSSETELIFKSSERALILGANVK